jgi:CheY-like chemotaxis protein
MSFADASVLVVDDQWTVRQQLARALGTVGIQCDCANDGDDALERCLHHHYELIVTDLRMPQQNGHSLAVTLLDQPDPPIVVVLTGVTDPRLTSDLLKRGVTDVVYKPVNFFDLADRLKQMLELAEEGTTTVRPSVADPLSVCWNEQAEHSLAKTPPTRHELEQLFAQSPPIHPWLAIIFRFIDWDILPNPPDGMRSALRQFSRRPPHHRAHLRSEGRVLFNEPAVALALDKDFVPDGHPFKLIIRDFSQHGIGLFHTKWLSGQNLAVSWHSQQASRLVVVTRVLRCRQVGEFFELGAIIEHFGQSTHTMRHTC